MQIIIVTIVTALVICAGDAVMIPLVMHPLFQEALGDQMLGTLRLGPAAAFYLIHVGGLVYFAGAPAIRSGKTGIAFLNGAILGLVAYSCYEMTSWTIMRNWNVNLVVVDMAWGTAISGAAAWLGAVVANKWRK